MKRKKKETFEGTRPHKAVNLCLWRLNWSGESLEAPPLIVFLVYTRIARCCRCWSWWEKSARIRATKRRNWRIPATFRATTPTLIQRWWRRVIRLSSQRAPATISSLDQVKMHSIFFIFFYDHRLLLPVFFRAIIFCSIMRVCARAFLILSHLVDYSAFQFPLVPADWFYPDP